MYENFLKDETKSPNQNLDLSPVSYIAGYCIFNGLIDICDIKIGHVFHFFRITDEATLHRSNLRTI